MAKRPYRFWTAEEDAALIQMWARGLTQGQIALKLKRTRGQVSSRVYEMRANGIDLPLREQFPKEYRGGITQRRDATQGLSL